MLSHLVVEKKKNVIFNYLVGSRLCYEKLMGNIKIQIKVSF